MTVESEIHCAVVGLVAPGARIEQVHQFRSAPLSFPARLVLTTDEGLLPCVVKTSPAPGHLGTESGILRTLQDLGFAARRCWPGRTSS